MEAVQDKSAAENKSHRLAEKLAAAVAENEDLSYQLAVERRDKAEASTRVEVDRTHAQLVDAYRELGARTTPFEASGKEVGLRFFRWL
jgi:hypothetical protein